MEVRYVVGAVVFLALLLAACERAAQQPAPEDNASAAEPAPIAECASDADCDESEQCLNGECVTVVEANQDPKKFCDTDADCICGGKDTETGECFIGNVQYYDSGKVDKEQYCPDFCTGIGGDLRTKCVAQQCTLAVVEPQQNRTADNSTGNLRLTVERQSGPAPFLAKFTADLYNVPDNAAEFYCTPQRWQFGDGNEQTITPNCPLYGPKARIVKMFKLTHLYANPDVYTARFSVGPAVSNPLPIAVSQSNGKSLRCSIPNPGKGHCDSSFTGAYYYESRTQSCKQVTGCSIEGEVPFTDIFSCQLLCTGGESIGSCVSDADCVAAGCASRWCMPVTALDQYAFPDPSKCPWFTEDRCYADGGCGCIEGRCAWNSDVEICLANYRQQQVTAK